MKTKTEQLKYNDLKFASIHTKRTQLIYGTYEEKESFAFNLYSVPIQPY